MHYPALDRYYSALSALIDHNAQNLVNNYYLETIRFDKEVQKNVSYSCRNFLRSECPTYTANICKVQDPVYSQVETSTHEDATVQNPEYADIETFTKDDASQSHVYAQIGPSLQEGVVQVSQNPAYGLFTIGSSTQDGIVQLSASPVYGEVETLTQEDDASIIYEVVD